MKIAYNPITSGALSTAPDNNDITFDLRGLNIFVKGVKFKGTDTTYSVFKKHTSSSGGGYNGLVPVPSYTSTNTRFLREDGTWQVPSNQYTYSQLTNQDLDTLKTEGKWFYLAGGNTVTNGPTNINGGGELYVGRNDSGFRYQKVISVDGLIWFRKWNSQSWSPWKRWYTDANTDSKVLQSNTTTTNYRPVILGYNNSTSTSNLSNNITEQVYTTTAIYAQPSTGNLWANKLYSGGKPVLTEHQSLANYVTLNTTQIITGSKTFSNPINSSFISSTHLDANKGRTIINSTANAGSYTMLFKGNSTNGYFTHGVYQGKYLLQYTTKSTVDAGTNAVTKSVTLLDESGNSQFSGSIYAPKFIGSLQGNADSATKLTTSAGSSSLPVYFLEGKPLACSPSSLFSNLSNSGNNISVTVAGQNRTLTINYANEANKLYSYGLPDSRSDKGGWYCKIASISLTSRFSSKSALLCITDEYTTTSNYPRYGFIYVKVQQQEELGTSPNITLRISGSLTTSLVTGILTLSSSSSKLDIYLKEDQHYQRGYVSFIHGKEDIRTNSQELIQTLPQGTIINSQYGDISNQTLSLLNSRKINGTSFNGTTDITTSYWGPTRTITLTGAVTGTVSTNGSGNIIINTTYDTNNISDLDSRYVNITGDTMTGDLGLPSNKSTIDGSAVFGGSITNISLDSLSNKKSIIGSFTDTSNTWHSVINVRHRNGQGDGVGYGMYIRAKLTSSSNLYWRQQYGGTWQSERIIIDNVNYTSYIQKIGTTTIGSTTKPIYLNAGTPTASNATVGAANRPIYISGGNLVAGTYTFGNANGNAAINNGTLNNNLNADLLDGRHASQFVYINGSLPATTNLNDVVTPGYYKIQATPTNTNPNLPSGAYQYGMLEVIAYPSDGEHRVLQLYYEHKENGFWRRMKNNTSWHNWVYFPTSTGTISNATNASKVNVINHTVNNTNYPIVWSNQSNINTSYSELYKSWQHLYYNPSTQKLTSTGGFIKGGSSDSYVLLGGGGHATLSGLGGSHTHTVFKNNVMVKGTNGISDSASIHLGIGDSDTGFKWISDGVCQMYANNVAIGQWNNGGMNWLKQPTVNGQKIWHAGNDGSGSSLDADLLDGVHLNAIFTELNYSKSRLTATIGTVKKTVNVTGSYPSISNVTMNTIASYGNCMGMASLASSNSNVNPNNQTSWHHFINMSYDTSPDNMWQSQIAIRAGTTEVWVRSRSGGTVQDNQAWQAPWVRLARTTDNVASATNADKLDGIHANGLLTALTSNSTTNLSLTVGGTTKTIADLYATQAVNADTVDNLHASSFMRCDGTNRISLTGGNGNTSGWRLVLEKQCGGQTINNIVLSVTSRHSGQGVLSIGFHTTNDTGTSYTYSINFKGSTASINSGAWRAFYNTSTKKFRLFWYHQDYNSTYINVLNRINFDVPKNGTWYETLPTDNGTELIIRYNTADKLGTSTVGNSTTPIYLNGGTPTICSVSTSGNANTIAIRDGSGDLQCRSVRATYANQSNISGALAFRVNNSSDNYIRFCSDRDVIRTWLGAAASSHNHDSTYVNVTGDIMTGRLTFNDGGIATSTTTSLQLGMYTPTHIYLQTAGTLYYSPKSGTNYRIWHAGNFNPNNYMRVALANGYYGMVAPQGDTSAWIRTTSSGILPSQSGTSTDGHCGIGTSTWYFNSAYIQNIHSHRMEASDGFYQQSDIRLKENIQKITSMSNIELVEFMWKKDKKKSYGVIAQQVEKYFPELVNIDKETGYKSVNYDAILIIKIAQLENKIKQLESKLL